MKNFVLNGYIVYDYIIAGAKKILQNEKQLNDINVFPVADGDTGTNLAYTMNYIIRNSDKNENVSITLNSISDAAVNASFGNSGTIFAKYLFGLSTEMENKKSITIKEFITGLNKAVSYAYESISSPKEGTILTLMKEWTKFLWVNKDKHLEFEYLLESSIDYSYNVLDETKELIEVLKAADVVDAGAKGFVCFIEGIFEYVRIGKNGKNVVSRIEHIDFSKIDHIKAHLDYKFCSEFTLEGIKVNKNELNEILKSFGDSIIINMYKGKSKIHIHTNDTEKLMLELIKIAKVVESKIDDMETQYNVVHNKKSKIGLVTDSIADLPIKYLTENNITVIPIHLLSEGTVYLDRLTVNGETVYEILDNSPNYPTTSQPSKTNIERIFNFLLNNFDEVIGVFVSDKMSGTFSKIENTLKELDEKGRVHLINTKLNSAGEGLIVKAAAEYINQGIKIEEIEERLQKDIEKTKLFVKIPDLNYAVKSGRVPKAVGSVASVVGLAPIITIDEKGNGSLTVKRSLEKIIKKQVEKNSIKEYSIIHTMNLEKAEKLAKDLEKITGKPPLFIENVSAVVSAFIGKGAYGVAFREE